MELRLPSPWISFPGLNPREFAEEILKTPEKVIVLCEWVRFFHSLSPAERARYERDYPTPHGWEWCYEDPSVAIKRNEQLAVEMLMRQIPDRITDAGKYAPLIFEMWQATTLKRPMKMLGVAGSPP